jgi:SAM-dependent methyltransferase
MKNITQWKPTKFEYRKGKLRTSLNLNEVSIHSRVVSDQIAQEYERLLPKYAQGKLLDLGCGKVPLYMVYKSLVEEVITLDWADSFHTNEFLDIIHDINEPLPLEGGQFDTVIMSDVLEHIKKPATVMNEIARVLKPGGHLIMNVPFMYWIHEYPHDYHRYTEYALRFYAEESGLEVIELKPVGGLLEIFVDLFGKMVARAPVIGHAMVRLAQWKLRVVKKISIINRPAQKSAKLFPQMYVMVCRKG